MLSPVCFLYEFESSISAMADRVIVRTSQSFLKFANEMENRENPDDRDLNAARLRWLRLNRRKLTVESCDHNGELLANRADHHESCKLERVRVPGSAPSEKKSAHALERDENTPTPSQK